MEYHHHQRKDPFVFSFFRDIETPFFICLKCYISIHIIMWIGKGNKKTCAFDMYFFSSSNTWICSSGCTIKFRGIGIGIHPKINRNNMDPNDIPQRRPLSYHIVCSFRFFILLKRSFYLQDIFFLLRYIYTYVSESKSRYLN